MRTTVAGSMVYSSPCAPLSARLLRLRRLMWRSIKLDGLAHPGFEWVS